MTIDNKIMGGGVIKWQHDCAKTRELRGLMDFQLIDKERVRAAGLSNLKLAEQPIMRRLAQFAPE